MIKRLLFYICAFGLLAFRGQGQSFQYTRSITVQSAQVVNADETNFPVYVTFTDPALKSAANGGHVQSSTGADISFFADSQLTQLLPFEIVSYNPSAGTLAGVVLCPRLSHSQNTVFYLGYGAAGMNTSQAAPATVWSGYLGVYHLEDNAANTTVLNSASGEGQAPNGTSVNNTSGMTAAGQLGSGLLFNGSTDQLDLGAYSAMNGATALTYSGWINFKSLSQYASILEKFDSSQNNGAGISTSGHWTTSDADWFTAVRTTNATADTTNSFGIQLNTWYYFTYVYSAGTVALYINGSQVSLVHYGPGDATSIPTVTADLSSGATLNAILDELRVSTRVFTANWIATEYNNQSNPAAFASLGTETPASSVTGPQVLSIQMLGATPTQAAFHYKAPDTNACTVQESTDPTFATVDHDVDPVLFPGSNLDTRSGNIVNGTDRTIVVGFRGTGTGSDGNIYSRALQAATTHYLQISCDNQQYTAGYTFQTPNPALGNTAPDYIPFNTSGFGNYGWPTINYTAATSTPAANKQIDPLTGFQLQRWTGAGDGGDLLTGWGRWSGVIDLAGAWTAPANILGSSGYASYSGAGGPSNALYMWGGSGIYRPSFINAEYFAFDDLQTQVNGYASVSGASYSVCLVYDGGSGSGSSDCLGNILTTALPQSTAATKYAPATFPQPILGGWGSPRVTNDMLSNTFGGSLASVNGSTVTWGSNSNNGQNVYFPVTVLKPGMRIGIANTAPTCPNNICTVASVQDEQHLTITQSISNWTTQVSTTTAAISTGATTIPVASTTGFLQTPWANNGSGSEITVDTGSNAESLWCTTISASSVSGCAATGKTHASGVSVSQNLYLFPNFGIKLWVNPNGGTVYLNNSQNNFAISNEFFTEYQGAGTTGCDGINHVVTYAADGVTPLATPTTGYLCNFLDQFGNVYLYLMIPSTGESRKLSNLNNGAQVGYGYNTSNGFMQNCTYNDNPSNPSVQKYAAWSDNRNQSLQNPAITCTYVQQTKTVQQEIAAAYPQIDFTYFGSPALQHMAYPYAKFMMRPQQGAMTWFCDLDISQPAGAGQVKYCHTSWDTYPSRFAGVHGFEYFIVNATNGYSSGWSNEYSLSSLNAAGTTAVERWDVQINQIYNNGGSTALTGTFTDPQTCQQLGVTDSRWIALGATGNNCIQMDVLDPVSTSAGSQDLQPLGTFPVGSKPGAWAHNASSCGGDGTTTKCWSYLQPIAPGDNLVDYSQSGVKEVFGVASVTPISGNANATEHVVLWRAANEFGQCASTGQAHSSGFVLSEILPTVCSGSGFILYPNGNISQGKMDNPQLNGGHIIQWAIGNQFILSTPYVWDFANDLGGYGAGYGVRLGQIPGIWGQWANWGVQSNFPFDGSYKGVGIGTIQSHAGGLTYACSTCEWIVDGRPLGGAGGGSNYLWNHTYTKVSGTNSVYLIDLPESQNTSLDLKRQVVRMWAGQHLIRNVSGPNSQLSDSTPWQGCIATNAGECVTGSQAGQIYEVVPQATTTLGCQIDMTINTPCVAPMAPEVAGYSQHDISAPDPFGLRGRVLTMAFGGPARTNNYANMHALTTGDWGVTTVAWGDGRRGDVWGVRFPGLPNGDSVNRTTFIKVPVNLGGVAGSSVRIRFGYAEYGSDANGQPLYCSPNRLEDCTTAPAPAAGVLANTFTNGSSTNSTTSISLGTSISVVASAATISSLGRMCVSGNSHSHTLQLLTSSLTVVASATVNMSGCTPNQFVNATLTPPVTVSGGQYYLMSSETNGGDSWYNQSSTITPSTAAVSVNGAVYNYQGSYGSAGGAGTSYGPLTLSYGANADPFAFASEPQSWTPCSTACTVNVPALSNRTLYYVVDRQLSGGSVVTGPLQVLPIN